jgi:hypothetical protein
VLRERSLLYVYCVRAITWDLCAVAAGCCCCYYCREDPPVTAILSSYSWRSIIRPQRPGETGIHRDTLTLWLLLLFWYNIHIHNRERPNMDYSLLVVTLSLLRGTSGPNQLGLVAKNVKEQVWLCRRLGQRLGPDTEPRRGTRGVRGFQQRSKSVSVTQNLDFL